MPLGFVWLGFLGGFLFLVNFVNLYSLFHFSAPPVSNIEPVSTKPGEHKRTENTITIEIDTEYFMNNDNGKQVFFGIAVCAKSNCKGKVLKR